MLKEDWILLSTPFHKKTPHCNYHSLTIIKFCIGIKCVYHCRSDSTSPSTLLSSSSSACYLVFESALVLLFSVCRFCLSRTVDVSKVTIGSFLRVTQKCSNCRRKYVWESQSFIVNVPAGNLLTSAAILYAGALPTKAMRVFSILNCVNITLTTFFRHQRKYLQPAISSISSIWEKQQLSLISSLKDQKKKLALSGDGRADSPGHTKWWTTDWSRCVSINTCDSNINSNQHLPD